MEESVQYSAAYTILLCLLRSCAIFLTLHLFLISSCVVLSPLHLIKLSSCSKARVNIFCALLLCLSLASMMRSSRSAISTQPDPSFTAWLSAYSSKCSSRPVQSSSFTSRRLVLSLYQAIFILLVPVGWLHILTPGCATTSALSFS